jgi:hypothetical protein
MAAHDRVGFSRVLPSIIAGYLLSIVIPLSLLAGPITILVMKLDTIAVGGPITALSMIPAAQQRKVCETKPPMSVACSKRCLKYVAGRCRSGSNINHLARHS